MLVFFCIWSQMKAQSLTEAEVAEKMNQAFKLSQNNQKAEALYLFLVVGENTKQQRNENERQVYVCSQTMACMCYESLEKYKDGYLLAKRLLQGYLNEEEQNDIGRLFAMNGYFYACDLIKRDDNGRTDYSLGREIISEILPYADEKLKDLALAQIPLSWYFEGMQYAMVQNYDKALISYDKALSGYKDLGKVLYEIDVLKAIASVKNYLCEFDESRQIYVRAPRMVA